jgi:hypothetical protein
MNYAGEQRRHTIVGIVLACDRSYAIDSQWAAKWNESYVIRRQAYVLNAQALAHAAHLAHGYAERRAHPVDSRQVTMCEI